MRQATDKPTPPPSLPHQAGSLTRRHTFGTFTALLLLGSVEAGATKAAELDGELLACCAEAHRLDRESEALCLAVDELPDTDSRTEVAYKQAQALMRKFHAAVEWAEALPARTPEGLRAKADLALSYLRDGGNDPAIALSVLRDVSGRAVA